MSKNISITKKVFALTAFIFCVYIAITLFGQAFFYGNFYTYSKRQELAKQVESFAKEYETLSNDDDINNALVDFSKNNDAYILIMGEQGNILYTASYEMTVQTDSGEIIRLSLDSAVHDKSFTDLNIKVGDTIQTEYYTIDSNQPESNIYIPATIVKGDKHWASNIIGNAPKKRNEPPNTNRNTPFSPVPMPNFDTNKQDKAPIPDNSISDEFGNAVLRVIIGENNSVTDISGTVLSITLPDEHNFQSSTRRSESAWAAIQWMNRIYNGEDMKVGERIHYTFVPEDSSNKYIVMVKKIEVGGVPQMIFAVNTLKSVDEAVDVMRDSFPIWIIIALIMVMIVSVLFSRLITRPIVNIMQVTKKMKNLDFSQKCVVQSDDEVGQLAANINDMSEKLDTTIRELVATNEKLTNDIEHERKIELARREFVAAVSHELKTPLAIIRAYSEGIADGISGERRDKYLNVIISETKKMDALVLDMLENSRLEAGVQKLTIKNYDISDMTGRIVKRFRNGLDDKNVDIIYDGEKDGICADFDRDMLEQVMNNFITNAVRHTPEGKKIYVSVKKQASNVTFAVENEGSHIDSEDLEKVWDRFYKADKSRDRSAGGTGLGLSIAKNILVLHRAKYGVENTDIGVKFWFRLKVN